MNALQEKLASAIKLRETEEGEEARQILLQWHSEFPEDSQVNYGSKLPCAWIHDLLGMEREAIPFYDKAIQAGLSGENLKSAWLGMGRTYRCTGKYQKAIETFQRGLARFPDSQAFKVFLGMAYYNIGEYSKW